MPRFIQIVAALILLSGCAVNQKPVDSVIRLSNGIVEIVLLPDVGGRLVRV